MLSASFVFAGRVLYASYESVHLASISPLTDQTLAGAIMWVPGSIVYLIPAVVFAMRVFSPERVTASEFTERLPEAAHLRGAGPCRLTGSYVRAG